MQWCLERMGVRVRRWEGFSEEEEEEEKEENKVFLKQMRKIEIERSHS